ncbi:MAG TPA: hypothetical protein VK524_19320, partial [Polyangiaceae bacterium]|nr:hypothetical protein [Polyangiaceae bacterium]
GMGPRPVLEQLRLPRAVLAYPAVGGIELAEIIDGEWARPLVYKLELKLPLAAFVDDTEEADLAVREALELFQVNFVHLLGFEAWPRVLTNALADRAQPYCLSVTDDELARIVEGAPLLEPWPALLANARVVLCDSETTRAELIARFALKEKRVRSASLAGAPDSNVTTADPRLSAWIAMYDACAARSAARAPWLGREQLLRLFSLQCSSRPLSTPPVRMSANPEPLVQRWVQGLRQRAPGVLRSAWKRLPYNKVKQQRKPR